MKKFILNEKNIDKVINLLQERIEEHSFSCRHAFDQWIWKWNMKWYNEWLDYYLFAKTSKQDYGININMGHGSGWAIKFGDIVLFYKDKIRIQSVWKYSNYKKIIFEYTPVILTKEQIANLKSNDEVDFCDSLDFIIDNDDIDYLDEVSKTI